jgi:hypothetical protein
MKNLLSWGEYDKYSEFSNRQHILLENEDADLNLKKVRLKVDYAIRGISIKYKFFAELVYNLRIIYTRQVPTAAVDGTNMFINPDFFAPLTEPQIVFIVCHEVMHCALLHFARIKGRDPFRWNIAGDYEINLLLADDGVLPYEEIKNELHGMIEEAYRGKNAEQLYDDPNMKMPESEESKDDEAGEDNDSDSTPGGGGGEGAGSDSGGREVLTPGNIIYDKASGSYGRVNSIDVASGDVDFEPLTKEQAEIELKKLKSN